MHSFVVLIRCRQIHFCVMSEFTLAQKLEFQFLFMLLDIVKLNRLQRSCCHLSITYGNTTKKKEQRRWWVGITCLDGLVWFLVTSATIQMLF